MQSQILELSPALNKSCGAGHPTLCVVVLTYNEEANLSACLASLVSLQCSTLVVDAGSTDSTRAIAESYGAAVVQHPFETHSAQWYWALSSINCGEWVLGLDADQRLTVELQEEIRELFRGHQSLLSRFCGFYVKRRQVFRGRWIKHGGYYPKYLLKLFRRSSVRLDHNDLVDHHFYVTGPTGRLRFDIIEENANENNITTWIEKHNRYAVLLAKEELQRKGQNSDRLIRPALLGNPDERTLWLKNVWFKMPRYVRPTIYFVYRYFLRLGFLDGEQGFVFHFLQGFWFRVLVDIKISEFSRLRQLINC